MHGSSLLREAADFLTWVLSKIKWESLSEITQEQLIPFQQGE